MLKLFKGGPGRIRGLATYRMVKCCACWRLGVPPSWLVILGAITVQIGYGFYPVLLKKFGVSSSPVVFSFYRDALCVPLLFLCAIVAERKLIFPELKTLLVFMLLGFTGVFGSQLLYILGVLLAGPDIASAIQPIIPVWTTILAISTCTEKLPAPKHLHTWSKVFGIILAVGGAIEITLTQDNSDSATVAPPTGNASHSSHASYHVSKHVIGYCCLFGNTILTSIYIVLQKRFIFNQKKGIWKSQPIYVTAYSYMFGSMFMGLATLYHVATKQYHLFVIRGEAYYALIYAVFITSGLCYMVFSWSNMHLSPTVVTAFWPVQVLVTALAAFFITGDRLELLQYVGAVLIIFALFLVLFSNHMDERVQSGKRILLVNCHLSEHPLPILDDYEYVVQDDEATPLITDKLNRKHMQSIQSDSVAV